MSGKAPARYRITVTDDHSKRAVRVAGTTEEKDELVAWYAGQGYAVEIEDRELEVTVQVV